MIRLKWSCLVVFAAVVMGMTGCGREKSGFEEDDFDRSGQIEFKTEYSVVDKGMESIS